MPTVISDDEAAEILDDITAIVKFSYLARISLKTNDLQQVKYLLEVVGNLAEELWDLGDIAHNKTARFEDRRLF